MRVAVLGGTGREGRGLALRWTRAGHSVVLGSRDKARALSRAAELSALGYGEIGGAENVAAASWAAVVVVSVPYTGHAALLTELRRALERRIVIDITVPLRPPRIHAVTLPAGQAAALEAQALLEPSTRVVAALHHVSSAHLGDPDHALDSDVLVCSDDDDARALVIGLVGDLGLRGLDAGPLANAVALETLTPVLLHLNERYKADGAGIRVLGLP
jgi:8-hydroxy-5-deazaflavin:NADPH oxidoreductase